MTLLHPDARLIDAATGAELSGVPLREAVHAAVAGFAQLTPGVVFLRTPTTVEAIVRYLGAFEAGRPLALLDPGLPAETLADFVERFEPAAVCGPPLPPDAQPEGLKGYTRRDDEPWERGTELRERGTEPWERGTELWERDTPSSTVPHPELATLLATSGSTGDPKLVRLSRGAVLANTTSIIEALGISGEDVAVSSLPFYYSFGMSVLNTHFAAGATVVVEAGGLVARSFWPAVDRYQVTSLALVPSQYEMLRRLRFDPRRHPSLRTLTQAGGRLRTELVRDFHGRMASVGGRLFVMYGQTEAAPRLTTLPAGRLAEKLGSVGPAVPGGRLTVRLEDGTETTAPGVVGEVLYRGPNVMMGYAETAADLARGDERGGLLETGDLGHLDEEGYLFIDGRLKRFGKVFGVRLNLDDVERLAAATGPGAVAAVAGDDKVVVFVEGATVEQLATRVNELADRLKLHWSGFTMRGVPALPLLSNGKVDYRALESAR
ncbi:AMP-binding protein [Dactylosporangium sp. NPDC050688]|uniref:AMP-binding protein n=1 Tax=Dactylosporangium sp. NPDC050688 TaxID=3157217 RepID=UPI0033C186E7